MPVNYQRGKIYTLVNDLNDIIYVGSTTQAYLSTRMTTHRRDALTATSSLYVAMRTLGADHFRIVLHHVFPCQSKDELEAEEYKVLKTFIDSGVVVYNARTAAVGGFKLSDGHKAKLSEAQTGKKLTDETKQKIAEGLFNFGSLTLQCPRNEYPKWVFRYSDAVGKQHVRSFSVKKYGDYGARFRAEEVRRSIYPEWGNEEDLWCDALGHIEWD